MGAAAPAVPVKDTVKRAAQNGLVLETPARETLFAVQTPQCFQTALYRRALAAVGRQRMRDVTDDCSIFELAGLPCGWWRASMPTGRLPRGKTCPHMQRRRRPCAWATAMTCTAW